MSNKNNRVLRINNKTINFYDYYLTNACVIKFVDTNVATVKEFFGTDIITGMEELNSSGDVIRTETFYLKMRRVTLESVELIEEVKRTIHEEYDEKVVDEHGEPVIDESTGQQLVIYHPEEYQIMQNRVPAEMVTVYLEAPNVNEEILYIKDNVVELKSDVSHMAENKIDKALFDAVFSVAQDSAQSFTDDKALEVKDIYPIWRKLVDDKFTAKTKGYKFTHEDVLYKTTKDNVPFQEQWVPGQGTESLYTRIDEAHAGTKEDPIPYHTNMEVFKDKYYAEDGVLYRCTRDSGIALHNKASELVGHYFEVVK